MLDVRTTAVIPQFPPRGCCHDLSTLLSGTHRWRCTASFPSSRSLTKDLIDHLRDRRSGIYYNAVLRNGFFRLMQSHTEFAFFWFSSPIIWISATSRVKRLVHCVKVGFKDEDAVK